MPFRPLQPEITDTGQPATTGSLRPLTQKQRVDTAIKIEQPRGVFGNLLPAAFAVGGGIIGGIAGAPAAGIGAIPGAIAGATGGAAIGETIQQGIEKSFGEREKLDIGQIGFTGLVGGITEATGVAALKVGKLALTPLLTKSKPLFTKALSAISGYDNVVLQEALKRGRGTVDAIKRGGDALSDIVVRSAKGLNDYAKKSLATAKATIKRFDEALGQGQPISVEDLTTRINQKLEGANIGVTAKESPDVLAMREQGISEDVIKRTLGETKGEGVELAFNRPVKPSRIVSTSEQGAIKEAHSALSSISENQSIEHIDAVFEKLLVLKSKTPSGSPTGAETKALIGEMIDELQDFVKMSGTTNKAYADYAKFLESNLRERVFITEMKELFGNTAHPSPKEISTISVRLLQMFNQGRGAIKGAVSELGKEVGEDITGTVSGAIIQAGDRISVRAVGLTRRRVVEQILQAVPRAMLKDYIATGKYAVLEQHPVIKKLAQTLGVTTKILIQDIVQSVQDKGTGEEIEI